MLQLLPLRRGRGGGGGLLCNLARRWVGSVGATARESTDAVVIGAGVVGLAVARDLALRGREVLVLDSAATFGTATSSRSSEVIHAGIYYPPNSLKASLCVRGRKLLYKFCKDRAIPHKQIGKLIVATGDAEIPKLEGLLRRGVDNGVEGLVMMESSEAIQLEPELHCLKALLSPYSGIIDSHSFMLSLMADAEAQGAVFSFNTSVIGGHTNKNIFELFICERKHLEDSQGNPIEPQLMLTPKLVINSAGLGALPLAKNFNGLRHVPPPYYARGCYFTLSNTKIPPFKHLIYPVPVDGGLGVHVTIDLDGQVKFGPDVEWIGAVDDTSASLNRFDYTVDPNRSGRFYPEIKRYYPNLKDGILEPGYAGIRAKLSGPGQPSADFIIQGEDDHGVAGLVNLFGIESPGLTSSLAIAEYISSKYLR